MDVAQTLIYCGRFNDATELLKNACKTAELNERAHTYAWLVECACEGGDPVLVQNALGAARRWRVRMSGGGTSVIRLSLAICNAEELLGRKDSYQCRQRLLRLLRALGDEGQDRWEALALGLLRQAATANTMGEFEAALSCIHEAEAVLQRCPNEPVALLALAANLLGVTLMMMPSSLDAASEQNQRAVRIARRGGLPRIAVASTLNDLAIAMWRGRAAETYESALQLLPMARLTASNDEFGRMSLVVARICLEAGDYFKARSLLVQIAEHHERHPRLRPRIVLLQAQLHLSLCEFEEAERSAGAAADASRDVGEVALEGAALLAQAEAKVGLEDWKAADELLSVAIIHLERHGSAHALERALQLRKRVSLSRNM